jgi:hypothetical protein
MRILSLLFILMSVLMTTGITAGAQEIFAINTERDVRNIEEIAPIPFLESVLYMLNPQTGAPSEIGPIEGYTRCTGLDIHPFTGEFFAVCEKIEVHEEPIPKTNADEIPFSMYLLILDPNTGQPTEVGDIELSRGDFISDISFRSDGTLFAHLNAGIAFLGDDVSTNTIAANSIGIINTQTAVLNIVGPTGSTDSWSAIGFNDMDSLIQCTDNRFTPGLINLLNQNTGSASFLGDLIYPPGFEGQNIVGSKDLDNLSGQFFALLFHSSGLPDERDITTNAEVPGNSLVTINQNTGAIDVRGFIADEFNQFAALAVRSEKVVAEVPTLSEYSLIATVVLLLGASVVFLRRRQIKSSI